MDPGIRTCSSFYDSLVSAEETEREQALADALVNLGHVIHLEQDTGVPAHVRDMEEVWV